MTNTEEESLTEPAVVEEPDINNPEALEVWLKNMLKTIQGHG